MNFQYLFPVVISLYLIVKLYLNYRQVIYAKKHQGQIPDFAVDHLTSEDQTKATNYEIAKIKFSTFQLLFSVGLLSLLIFGGILDYIWNYFSLNYGQVFSATATLCFITLIQTVVSLPLSWAKTFVLEEKFGFNRTTQSLFFKDTIKSIFLGMIIGLPFIFLVFSIINSLPQMWWPYVWAVTLLWQGIIILIYPQFIAPLFNKFTPFPENETKELIRNLAKKINFPLQDIYTMDAGKRSGHGNAYFTGLGKKKRIVFFDTLLDSMNPKEITAILAHELGHFKLGHIKKSLIVSAFSSLIFLGLANYLVLEEVFYQVHFVEGRAPLFGIILLGLVSGFYQFFMTPIGSLFSRKNEYEADDFAKSHGLSVELETGLIKLYKKNSGALWVDSVYSFFYYSHPPAKDRIENLRS